MLKVCTASQKLSINPLDKAGIGLPDSSFPTWTHLQHFPAARALYGKLLRAAGRQYVETLRQGTRTGTLLDPYEEFCVEKSRFINRGTLEMDYTDEYWGRQYTVSFSLTSYCNELNLSCPTSCVTAPHSAC